MPHELQAVVNKLLVNYDKQKCFENLASKTHLVHRLVAQAFIPNPENKPEVDHKDNNRGNAFVENLQWVTSSALARKFKLSLSAIADVIHYRTYKDVD